MSTRWYPIYQRGNPRLRIFLPNFWMKLIKPKAEIPSNVVHFNVSMEMTVYDVRNYLEKIYSVPVVNVRTFIKTGRFKKAPGKSYIIKNEDEKIAVVTMPQTVSFKFPEIFPKQQEEKLEKQYKQLNESEQNWDKIQQRRELRRGIPTWFSI